MVAIMRLRSRKRSVGVKHPVIDSHVKSTNISINEEMRNFIVGDERVILKNAEKYERDLSSRCSDDRWR